MSRRKWRKLKRQIKGLMLILIAVMLVCILGALGNVLMMLTDTLDKLNAIDVELETSNLSEDNIQSEQFVDEQQKINVVTAEHPLTTSEREYITRVCMAEAGTDLEGNMAVATVILDRATLWNMTPLEVVNQPNQFATPRQGELYEESVQAVWSVFDEGMRATEENITHFYAEGSDKPYWAEDKQFVCSRGGNRFYR
jgi:spore germination cell wall hydrolase CwlJ-like protein